MRGNRPAVGQLLVEVAPDPLGRIHEGNNILG